MSWARVFGTAQLCPAPLTCLTAPAAALLCKCVQHQHRPHKPSKNILHTARLKPTTFTPCIVVTRQAWHPYSQRLVSPKPLYTKQHTLPQMDLMRHMHPRDRFSRMSHTYRPNLIVCLTCHDRVVKEWGTLL